MLSFFCAGCGTLTLGNTIKIKTETAKYYLSCACGFAMVFQIHKERVKTPIEVEDVFQKTPLTDSQKGSSRKRISL
jgi:transcription elongation factor Elf1